MVKKLFKYEIASWVKTMLPIEIAVLGTAVFNRILQFFEKDNTVYDVISVSSIVLLVIAVLVSFFAIYVIGVRRFYKNLFTQEGYLTMSLPVRAEEQLLVKLLTALLFALVAVVGALLAASIAMAGEFFTEFWKAVAYLFRKANVIVSYNLPAYVIEFFLVVLFAIAKNLLVFYLCVSLGQTTKKNRVGAAVGFFFVYYFVLQAIGTVFAVIVSVQAEMGLLDAFIERLVDNPIPYFHLFLIVICIWEVLFGVLYFFLSRHILTHKLNLE